MEQVFCPPSLTARDRAVIAEIDAIRAELSDSLRAPRRWLGTLLRDAQAKAIKGSNSIEGYLVSEADAVAAVEGVPAWQTDQDTWAEIVGYRRVMTYVLNVATSPGFQLDQSVIRSMHFMLLEHDLTKAPGNYRTGPIYVSGERGAVYTGPEAERVPALMAAFVEDTMTMTQPALVKGAMAHLNLVAIHPFRDGNGRMGRVLQTLVLAQDDLLEPTFSSIEEWLGANSSDYHAALAATQLGGWRPENDTSMWIRFNLRAHHMQAQTTRRRVEEASRRWVALDGLLAELGLAERVEGALFDALLGWRVARQPYADRTGTDARTATRDFGRMVEFGLLSAHGQTRGRYYTAGPRLEAVNDCVEAARPPLTDPYPGLVESIRLAAAQAQPSPNVLM